MTGLGILYLIHQITGLGESFLEDPLWAFELEKLPDGSFILVRDITRAKNGFPFSIYVKQGEPPIKIDGIPPAEFSHYMTIFNNCELFGLPHGGGWANELPWLIYFLSHMKEIKQKIEAWHYSK